jgi:hypothetical protein
MESGAVGIYHDFYTTKQTLTSDILEAETSCTHKIEKPNRYETVHFQLNFPNPPTCGVQLPHWKSFNASAFVAHKVADYDCQ